MKKAVVFLTIVVLAMSVLFSGCSAGGGKTDAPKEEKKADVKSDAPKQSTLNGIREKGKFVVGLDDNFPPMGFRDEKGEIVGFDIDMAKEAAKRLGVDVEFKAVDWDGVILSLKNKDIDVIWNGLTITEKRKEQIDYSKPYIGNRQIVMVKSGSSIKTKADLAGKVLGFQQGSSSEDAIQNNQDVQKSLKEIKKYPNFTDALMELSNGRVDAVLIDEIVGRYYMTKKAGEFEVIEEDLGSELYGVGIRKEDKEFREELDRVLDEMKADGSADKISERWFGKAILVK